ncbi:translocation protein S66 [Aspergillus alliaceus]|uniref:Translocation protein S66 n=1 Tax=Petromyces alliaceus TaxID=209559 RepID=A0A5N6FNJ4_PETAA|nr:Pre protein translocase subunit Sec66-domain-containing protein [Aspergillus alliaceus]KAB8230173.1 Pre protein translocase subunit Sec66-domain-containing protein [Aspergillus alliaceus]KAF5863426.1 translocation protein S66 [Aspergillus burnettii]
MVNWLSLAVPFAYLGVLIGSLATFSSLYRKRKAQKAYSLEPWFPAHLQRDIYFSLLHIDPPASSSKEKKAPAVPESVLKAALLRRAEEDIRRVLALRSQKQALGMLLQRGSVGDDLWQRFQRAEKEMEDEVRDVVSEANAYVPGWGQTIFQSANEMMNNTLYRERIAEQQSKLAEERQWWEKKKASIKDGFMKELDAEGASSTAPPQKVEPAPVTTPTTTSGSTPTTKTPESSGAPSSVTGSDDDAVLVEAHEQPGSPASLNKKKKKKGKK